MIYRIGLLLLLMQIPATHADWGRLFHTPEQRAERTRGMQARASEIPGKSTVSLHYFSGEIQRTGGQPLRWIDGQIDRGTPPKRVKPGESWDSVSGVVYPAGRKPVSE